MTPTNKLNLVIDTNALLVSISERSSYHWFYKALINKGFNAFVTTEILSEYEEIIGSKMSTRTATAVIRTLMELDNIIPTTIYFKYKLIHQDPDDDKFANCAINSNAHFLVTHDKHFDVLKTIGFPRIKTITLPELKELLQIRS